MVVFVYDKGDNAKQFGKRKIKILCTEKPKKIGLAVEKSVKNYFFQLPKKLRYETQKQV